MQTPLPKAQDCEPKADLPEPFFPFLLSNCQPSVGLVLSSPSITGRDRTENLDVKSYLCQLCLCKLGLNTNYTIRCDNIRWSPSKMASTTQLSTALNTGRFTWQHDMLLYNILSIVGTNMFKVYNDLPGHQSMGALANQRFATPISALMCWCWMWPVRAYKLISKSSTN